MISHLFLANIHFSWILFQTWLNIMNAGKCIFCPTWQSCLGYHFRCPYSSQSHFGWLCLCVWFLWCSFRVVTCSHSKKCYTHVSHANVTQAPIALIMLLRQTWQRKCYLHKTRYQHGQSWEYNTQATAIGCYLGRPTC